ncbi:MAG: tripartite tricarboxylate transporter substrate binding protein [Rhodovarius sp.]|nr:tripartite tricarboxylate transporter substrate binding protein [Rhodovarius sp.]
MSLALSRRRLAALSAGLALPRLAAADPWPGRPIRLVVPVAPGGSQDVVARLSARGLSERLPQPVQVENISGGGSAIGYALAARAAPDGHVMLAGADTLSIIGAVLPQLSFDPLAFTAVHRSVRVPQILVVRADHPAQDFAQWVRLARQQPPAVGTPGHASLAHLLVEQLASATGATWTHVPYRGGALAVADLMGGQLQGVMINIGAVAGYVREGRLRGLLVSPARRSRALPEVPTLGELGLADLAVTGWHGLLLPPGADPALALRLNRLNRHVLAEPAVAERLAAIGVEPTDEGPEELAAALRADAARFAEVVRRHGILA